MHFAPACASRSLDSTLPWPRPPARQQQARPWRSAICGCLAMLCCGCASPLASQGLRMPPSLDRPCDRGPALPERDVEMREFLRIIEAREAAATDCALRNDAWRQAWPR